MMENAMFTSMIESGDENSSSSLAASNNNSEDSNGSLVGKTDGGGGGDINSDTKKLVLEDGDDDVVKKMCLKSSEASSKIECSTLKREPTSRNVKRANKRPPKKALKLNQMNTASSQFSQSLDVANSNSNGASYLEKSYDDEDSMNNSSMFKKATSNTRISKILS